MTNLIGRLETILVVDDVPDWLDTCSDILGDQGYKILTAASALAALKILEDQPIDLVVTDMTMPEMSGLELVRRIREADRGCGIILMTGYPTVETAVTALKGGASDYLVKPFTPEQLLHSVGSTLDKTRLMRENQFLESQVAGLTQYGELIGRSEPMHQLYQELERAAGIDASVLLTGESGTGKELAARILHRKSPRAKKHFAAINCAAIPDNLLESELFGHEAGAFTGATETRLGLLENAEGGTVFLDEIGEMPGSLQVKLLRVIEDRKVRRLGSNKERVVNVRFISATNRDLAALIGQRSFREDLYYRLNVIMLRVPPLRERKEDILLLLQHFFKMYGTRARPAPRELTPEARDRLLRYSWPGNVRELANLAQFLIFADRDGLVREEDLPRHFIQGDGQGGGTKEARGEPDWAAYYDIPFTTAKKRLFETFEDAYVRHSLLKHDWNISAAAEASGIDRRTIHRIVNKLGLKRPG
ncbi:MAG TPA: sigma-54 dependent transcriptional regulator [Bdellovibrionota bacterium]|nr:sigma-54 dependent transcriptional regulator [Bdellovibrionota bacterium]